ncbi:MAG TPA: RnfH family protein [Acidiferrobacterales bacterium]|jgi:hypothetical protein
MERVDVVQVEVVYAAADEQVVLTVELAAPATVEQAIRASGMLARFPQIDLARQPVGIHGRRAALHDPLRDGDRVEIYRPLIADPKAARRRRAGTEGRRR